MNCDGLCTPDRDNAAALKLNWTELLILESNDFERRRAKPSVICSSVTSHPDGKAAEDASIAALRGWARNEIRPKSEKISKPRCTADPADRQKTRL